MKKPVHIYVALEDVECINAKKGSIVSSSFNDHSKAYLERVDYLPDDELPRKDEETGLNIFAEYIAAPRKIILNEDSRFKYITSVEIEFDN